MILFKSTPAKALFLNPYDKDLYASFYKVGLEIIREMDYCVTYRLNTDNFSVVMTQNLGTSDYYVFIKDNYGNIIFDFDTDNVPEAYSIKGIFVINDSSYHS